MFECCLVLWHLNVTALPLWLEVKILQVLYAWLASLKLVISCSRDYHWNTLWEPHGRSKMTNWTMLWKETSKAYAERRLLNKKLFLSKINAPVLIYGGRFAQCSNIAARALSQDWYYRLRSGTLNQSSPRVNTLLFTKQSAAQSKLHTLEQQCDTQIGREFLKCACDSSVW